MVVGSCSKNPPFWGYCALCYSSLDDDATLFLEVKASVENSTAAVVASGCHLLSKNFSKSLLGYLDMILDSTVLLV